MIEVEDIMKLIGNKLNFVNQEAVLQIQNSLENVRNYIQSCFVENLN